MTSTTLTAAPDTNKGRFTGLLMIALPLIFLTLCILSYEEVLSVPPGLRGLVIAGLLISLFMTGMPISIALGLSVLTFMFTMTSVPIVAVSLKLFTGIEKFEIMSIPFFILAGNFLTHGGVAKRMIHFASTMVGHWYGGMGLAGVVSCALFAAISGSSVATVVAIGSIMLPAMVEQGYPKRFGAGVIATSGALGILFPPSINLVIYAVATSGMNPPPVASRTSNPVRVNSMKPMIEASELSFSVVMNTPTDGGSTTRIACGAMM